MWSRLTHQLIELACEEDLGQTGDITSALLPGGTTDVTARVVPRAAGIICGLALGPAICDVFSKRLGRPLEFAAEADDRDWQDGNAVKARAAVATVRGALDAVLAVERTLLNFLARMSGVATLTHAYVQAARAVRADVKILDTRKTIPGWRELDKYAVHTGGGKNHRLGLHDAVLIKDNHLTDIPVENLAAALTELLGHMRGAPTFVEVEVDRPQQFRQVCSVPGVDIVLLDNFSLDQMRAAVEYRDAQGLRGKLALEASGGVTLETVTEIAATGVDRISIGALTHSAASLDIGLDL